MKKRIAVNGIEIGVGEDDLGKFIAWLERQGLKVDDLDGWENTVTHEPYDVETLLIEAKEYSDQRPPHYLDFSEKTKKAVALCFKEFLLKRLGLLIKSDSAESNVWKPICYALSDEQSRQVSSTWFDAQMTDSYELRMETEEREKLVDSIRQMPSIIEQANLEAVNAELNSMNSISFRNVAKGTCKIGNHSYDYTRIVY